MVSSQCSSLFARISLHWRSVVIFNFLIAYNIKRSTHMCVFSYIEILLLGNIVLLIAEFSVPSRSIGDKPKCQFLQNFSSKIFSFVGETQQEREREEGEEK